MAFDPDSATLSPGQFDPSSAVVAAPPPPRSAVGEVFTGVKRGALVGLPSMVGRALQYTSEPGRPVYEAGRGMVSSAEERGQSRDLSLRPEEHNAVTNALAAGGEMLAPSVAIPAAAGLAAAGAGASPFVATALAATAGGALFGAEAGQTTLEKGRKAGLDEDTARAAARLNAGTTMAAQTGMGMVGGQLLGTFGRTLGRTVSREGETLAAQTMADLMGTGGVLKPLAKTMAATTGEAVAINALQAEGSSAIERAYGVDNTPVGEAGAASIAPTLGLTALMGPMALVTRAMGARAAKQRTEALAHPETPEGVRTQLADSYTERLAAVDPAAAAAFQAHAREAISNQWALPVDSTLLSPDWKNPNRPPSAFAAEAMPRLGYEPQAGTMFVGSDGSVGTRQDFEAFGMNEASGVRRPPELVPPAPPAAPAPAAPDLRTTIENAPPRDNSELIARMQPQRDLVALHEQVRQGLQSAGIEPARPMTREEFAASEDGKGKKGQTLARAYRMYLLDPATERSLMERDADAYDAMERQRTAEEDAAGTPRNPPPVDTPRVETPAPSTAMADAMQRAIKARDEARALQEREAKKGQELDAIQNIARGEQLADAAERGEVRPDPNAPMARDALEGAWKSAMEVNEMDTKAQSRVPFFKRLDSMGVFDMQTHAEQIAALESIVNDKKASQGVRDRASMLAAELRKDLPREEPAAAPVEQRPAAAPALDATPPGAPAIAGEPSVTAKVALGENIPAKPPAPAAPPAIPGAQAPVNLGENIRLSERNMPVTDMAEAAADKVMELRMGFTERLRKGEQLSDLEKERYEDLNGLARSLQPYLEGNARPSDAEFVKSLAQFVEEASSPYKKSLRAALPGPKMADPMETNMALLAPAALSGKVSDVLTHLEQNGSEKWVRDLAAKLKPLLPDTTIKPGESVHPNDSGVGYDPKDGSLFAAEYHEDRNHIDVYPRGAREHTVLHESVHAATHFRIEQAKKISTPKNQEEARLKKAYDELETVRTDAAKLGQEHYGLSSPHEFVAELHSNPEFQEFLQKQKVGPTTLWERVVSAVGKLLGRDWSPTALDKAMRLSEEFFSDRQLNERFDASPEGAAVATGAVLRKAIDLSDVRSAVDTGKIDLNVLRGVLPLQTTQYIAHRVRTNPELAQTGFAAGVDAHLRADQAHSVVVSHLRDIGARYVADVGRVLRGLDSSKARALEAEMMTIGGEASRVGFDFRKNGRDNIAADKSIDPADKPYIDEIHRRWTQLQKSNPEAAKLLEEGERVNRRILIEKVATVAANLMDQRAGRARHLEAELQRMTPQDANYARKADEVKLANTEALLADAYARRLDLMDASLAQGKNPDPARFHDTATANLGGRLQQAFDAARALPDGAPLKDALRSLESMYAKESKNPYFSLGRDGDFFVSVKFKGVDQAANARIQKALEGTGKVVGDLTRGDSSAFFRVNSADEARALHDKLVTAGEGKVVDTAWNRLANREGLTQAASAAPALRSMLAAMDDMPVAGLSREQADLVKQALTRQMLSMLPETAARSASMGRKGVPGYDANFLTMFARRAEGGVHDTAGVYTSRSYAAAAQQRAQAIEQLSKTGSDDARQRAVLVNDEIGKKYSNNMQPVPGGKIAAATALSYSYYLGLSPANFIRTTVQPWHRGIPFVGSKFGHANAMGELLSASGTALKVVAQSVANSVKKDGVRGLINAPVELQGLGLSPADQAFVQEMHAAGKLDLGESQQLASAAMPGNNRRVQDAVRYAAATVQYAEMANRFAIGLTAFRLASKRPNLLAAGETPAQYALRAIDYTMDDFSPSNTARAIGRHGFAGPATPLLTQFQNYNLQTMQQIARTVHDGFFGQDKSPEGLQRAKEARREFAGLMATTATIAGALGMPFANAFAGVYNTLMSDKDDPKDVRMVMRQWAEGTFGKEVGTVLMKGLPSLANLDTGTFGAQNILPGSDFLVDRTKWKDRTESQMRSALGPAVNLGLDLTNAVQKMTDGYWLQGIEAALPIGLRTAFKTAGLVSTGQYTDSKGNPLPIPVGASDIAWRALGFQTESKAAVSEAQRDFILNQQARKARRENISGHFVQAVQDPAEMATVMADMQRYNERNPLSPLTGHDLSNAVRGAATRYALGQTVGGGISVTRRQLPQLLQDEAHAAMPSR